MRSNIKAGSAYVELLLKDGAFIRKLRTAGQKLKAFGSDMQAMGRTLAMASAAILVPMAMATKTFADFDDKMREVKAVTQATSKEFAAMAAHAKHLGATTSFTAIEVAGLKAEIGRAGFSTKEVDAMTESVLNLSRATGTDATQSAGIMAATLRQFNLEAKDSGRVADALTVAANKSFTSVEGLGESLSYAGPVAADANMSLEETLAILGALGNVGIQGSNSGTAVRRLVTLNAAEAEKLKGIFGVDFLDAAGNARRLVDTLDDVAKATNKMPTGERAKKFNDAFGLLGITGASAISKNVVAVRDLENALYGAEGAAAATAKEMDAGIGGSIRILQSAAEGAKIAIGEALAPAVEVLAEKLTQLADATRDASNNNQEAVNSFASGGLVLAGYAVALTGVGGAYKYLGWSLGGLAKMSADLAKVTGMARLGPYGAALAAGMVAKSLIDTNTALSSAAADKKAAQPIGDIGEIDKLKQRLEIISEKDVLDPESFKQAESAVKSLEKDFGPLGITIDQATNSITGLENAFAMIDATRVLKNAETQITTLKEQIKSIGAGDPAKLAGLEAKLKMFAHLAKEARMELDGVGTLAASSVNSSQKGKAAAAAAQAEESKIQTLAKQIGEQMKSLHRRDGAGTYGGQDLANRLTKTYTSIGQLNLAELKRNNALTASVLEVLKQNPGLVGA
jgi:TP901 family phage tail tape measure protein